MDLLRKGFLMLVCSCALWAEEAIFCADQAIFSRKGKEVVLSLQGNILVQSSDYTIHAGTLLIEGESQNKLEGSDGISLTNSKDTLTIRGHSFSLDRQKGLLMIRGKVNLVDLEKNLSLSAMEVQILGERKQILAMGAVSFTKDSTYGEAEVLRFDEENNTLDLIGQARLEQKGKQMEARRIWVNLSNNQLLSEEKVKGKIQI